MCSQHNPFSSVFPFCTWLLPKSQWFNQQQAKLASVGRLWSYAGIVVWLRAMWTQVQKRTRYFDVHSFYMRHTCTSYLRFLRGEWAYAGACCVSCCICFTSCVKLQWREEQGVYSVVTTWLIWYCSPLLLFHLCTETFLFGRNQILSLTSTAVPDSLTIEL